MYKDEVTPYKKKTQSKPPKKARHKHDYQPCIFEYDGIRLDKAHGFVPSPDTGFGSYCTICGKIGASNHDRWSRWVPVNGGPAGHSEYTEEAQIELNPETRTLPTFRIEDIWSQKFVTTGMVPEKERGI